MTQSMWDRIQGYVGDPEEFLRGLKLLAVSQGISQAEIAEEYGCGQPEVSRWFNPESRESTPRIETLLRLERAVMAAARSKESA